MIPGQQRFSIVTQIDDDIIASDFFDCARYQFTHAILIIADYDFALGFANFLYDYLLGGLRSNTTKLDVVDLFFVGVSDGQRLIFLASLFEGELRSLFQIVFVFHDGPDTKRFVVSRFAINRYPAIDFFIVVEFFGCCGKGAFYRLKNHTTGYAFLIRDGIRNH